MAASITHIVLTQKIFDQHFSDKNRREFFVGTVLPDIRYLGKIDRGITHFTDLKLDEIKKENSFTAGLKFHSLLDVTREKFIVESGVYEWYPDMKYITRSLKLFEDEILYARVGDWPKYIKYLDEIVGGELALGLDESVVGRWHQMLKDYWVKPPDNKSQEIFMAAMGFSPEVIVVNNSEADILRGDERVMALVESLYDSFNTLVG
ncbi:MAG: hypothetical protein A2261_03535 [Candidatus Magasanikbacteria bacterium RIFOXYA2_FULL_44_8]|uniref:Uncharacterized protein n=1 Tax=Candidatus Magasanikbacteria bacterium RIFOXYA2_FULL_44_8 TaxID=1798696 RepID=A0A1F6NIL8_9BACT|nr:MAG: hypothetical protein A2261_03535 [Candidatus Magasanikbacteria bacterium RIFOXYA2_FULL_44_8]